MKRQIPVLVLQGGLCLCFCLQASTHTTATLCLKEAARNEAVFHCQEALNQFLRNSLRLQ